MKKIKIGVMGCAAIAERSVIPAILQVPSLKLVCVASRSLEKAKRFAERFQCDAVEGYDKLLNQDIDAVYMPLPCGLHMEWGEKTILTGKHIFLRVPSSMVRQPSFTSF